MLQFRSFVKPGDGTPDLEQLTTTAEISRSKDTGS